MKEIVNEPTRFRRYAAGLVLSAVALALLAVAVAGGPAQAQDDPPLPTPTPAPTATPVPNVWPNPQPCGPGAETAFQPEPHKVTEGHFALFDAYWRSTGISTGVLHTNLCPPLVEQTTESGPLGETTTTSYTSSGIDIGEAIMHVLDEHKVAVVATNAEATAGQLSLQEYPEVRAALGLGENDAVPAGTQVWWLRLDDPDTAKDETSKLGLGFSAALLDGDYWHLEVEDDEGDPVILEPMRYKFLVDRYPADPDNLADVPHFLAYEAPEKKGAEATLVWDSSKPAVEATDMLLDAGEYRPLQWIFTHAGTYLLSVELQAFVRTDNPLEEADLEYDARWRRISGNETEASEVKTYTIQVGTEFDEVEPPVFGVSLSVAENSPGGVKVGDPIPVYRTESTVLEYLLGGAGHDHFELVATTKPHAVQIVVADGARLDYETKASYDLTLAVTNKVDHEGNADSEVDDTLAIRIDLEDQKPGVVLYTDPIWAVGESVSGGDTVRLYVRYEPTPEHRDEAFVYQWAERISEDGELKWRAIDSAPDAPSWSVSHPSPTAKTYQVSVALTGTTPPVFIPSNDIRLSWIDIDN